MRSARTFLAILAACGLSGSAAIADYGEPWLPDWSAETGYTSQYWGLHAVDGAEPAQPLAADNYADNPYGTPEAVWDTQSPQGYWGWLSGAMPEGTHPDWCDEVWGGMVELAGNEDPIQLSLEIPSGSESGTLQVFVQFDWFNNGASMVPEVSGATDVTPDSYYDVVIGTGGSSSSPWLRVTRVFEFSSNPATIDIVFNADGSQPYAAPMLDSFSVTTAVDAPIPPDMPVPEPGTLLLVVAGALVALAGRRG